MIGPSPEDLRRHGRLLDDAAEATADVAARLAEAWTDATGSDWVDHLRRIGHDLDDLATELFDRADATDRGMVDVTDRGGGDVRYRGMADPGYGGTPEPTDRGTAEDTVGVQIGGLSGMRATRRRGVVVPTLPAPP